MKRGKRVDPWYPFFIDKWLFGSTRLELIINPDWAERWPQLVPLVPESVLKSPFTDLRGIFSDLLTFSKKDCGYIRANERTGYPHEMLAGQFGVPIQLLKLTISICLHKDIGKMSEPVPGIYYIESTEAYSFTERHKRRIEEGARKKGGTLGPLYGAGGSGELSGKTDVASQKGDAIGKERIGEDRIGEDNNGPPDPHAQKVQLPMTQKEMEDLFDTFWKSWPVAGRHAKVESRQKFLAICKRGRLRELQEACGGYSEFLAYKKNEEGFKQNVMYAKTFLNGRWEDFIGVRIKPKL